MQLNLFFNIIHHTIGRRKKKYQNTREDEGKLNVKKSQLLIFPDNEVLQDDF